jgi:hypothetical protein
MSFRVQFSCFFSLSVLLILVSAVPFSNAFADGLRDYQRPVLDFMSESASRSQCEAAQDAAVEALDYAAGLGKSLESTAREIVKSAEDVLSISCDLSSIELTGETPQQLNSGQFEGECGDGWSLCKNGTTKTCCENGKETCETAFFNIAYCAVKDETVCKAGEKFCAGSKSNACCPSSASCGKAFDAAFCKLNDICEEGLSVCKGSKGHTDCCSESESCKSLGHGFKGCSANSCGDGQTRCNGKKFSICCDNATEVCSPSSKGAPFCIPREALPEQAGVTTGTAQLDELLNTYGEGIY